MVTTERIVEEETVSPSRARIDRTRLMYAAGGFSAFLLAALLISSLFVDYGNLLGEYTGLFGGISKKDLSIRNEAYEKYFTVTVKQLRQNGRVLLELKRTDQYPTDENTWKQLKNQVTSLPERVALDQLARGYLRVEFVDKEGTFNGFQMLRVKNLNEQKRIQKVVKLPDRFTAWTLVLTY